MRKYILTLLVLGLLINILSAVDISTLYQSALRDYQEKNYDYALKKFLTIQNEGINSSDLYYNTANCFFRLGNLGYSILYYKKALKLSPDHKMAAKNLKFVQSYTKDKIEQLDKSALEQSLISIYNSITINTAALISIILLALLVIIIIITNSLFRYKDKSLPAFLIILILILLAVSITISYNKYSMLHDDTQAVILDQTVAGYSGPSDDFQRVFTIHEGMTCHIEDENNNWVLVKLPNGIGGWIQSNSLQRITLYFQ